MVFGKFERLSSSVPPVRLAGLPEVQPQSHHQVGIPKIENFKMRAIESACLKCRDMNANPPHPPQPPSTPIAAPPDEELCLMGVNGLAEFMDFVRTRAVDGAKFDRGDLAEMWRAAAEVFAALQTSEAGAADHPKVLPLSASAQAHVKLLADLPYFQQTFSAVPVAFGMVELDTLVVSQQHITRSSVERMHATLRQPLPDKDLTALCLPLAADTAGFRLAHQSESRFTFVSDTHDARFLGAQLLDPAALASAAVSGYPLAAIGLAVGFTTNVLNVVRYGNRLVLNNGYHRAHALRERGITHAPCLIQVCSHWEDVGLAGSGEIFNNGPVYFSSARPPLLRDFANPSLTRTFATRPVRKEIRISFEVETTQLAI